MKASVVIGSGYGDEGKGLFTDYLSSQYDNSLVIRFNGGSQAGHTVTTPEGLRHVFGHFGSNSLLAGNQTTYLSSFFILNPMIFKKEKKELILLGKYPKVIANENAYITTPYDMILNQLVEKKRNNSRHGSCGLGIGETIERCERKNFNLQLKDIKNVTTFKEKLITIKNEYVPQRAKELDIIDLLKKKEYEFLFLEELIDKFIEDTLEIFQDVEIINKNIPEQKNIIFEGAQGLLLDQDLGNFPYVTRSNTGLKNVISLIKNSHIKELDIIYASRCYTTKHGAGPLKNILPEKPYEKIEDLTNIPNEYQGALKFSYLDINVLQNIIQKDLLKAEIPENIKINIKLGLTCLDQTDEISFYQNDELKTLFVKDFIDYLQEFIGYKVITSWGPTRKTIKHLK